MRMVPVVFVWQEVDIVDGDGVAERRLAMVPLKRYGNVCGRQYHPGEEYPLAPLEARSRASHNHYFAALDEGFKNLPENIAARWPTSEHMRAWILVETGWFDEHEFDFDNEKDARRLATFVRTEAEYARISVSRLGQSKWKVIVRRPKSQSAAAMGKVEFEQSKRDVLDMLAAFINVPRGTLVKQAGRNA